MLTAGIGVTILRISDLLPGTGIRPSGASPETARGVIRPD
jgi:hypothetical protein